ncbi:TPA: hypothetical protein HA251_04115 [Candidatus Woesearchaeota archaeon]|nr:hypothetical protein [Candidatus Woesearchaeota archaeon]
MHNRIKQQTIQRHIPTHHHRTTYHSHNHCKKYRKKINRGINEKTPFNDTIIHSPPEQS